MKIIPVLDLMNGLVVRGVAGDRNSYQPVQSQLTNSSVATDVAVAIRDSFRLTEFYVADLDAIVSGQPNHQIIDDLTTAGMTLLVDVGLRSVEHVRSIEAAASTSVIVALESIDSLDTAAAALDRWGPKRTLFSLDLKHGQLLGKPSGLNDHTPEAVVKQVAEIGFERIVVLDLAAVGMGSGVPTLDLCRSTHTQHPRLQIVTGGGVNSIEDLLAAYQANADGLLIASALHDGRIRPRDLTTMNIVE